MPITDEAVIWGFRLLLGREVPDQSTIDFHKVAYDTVEQFRRQFMQTTESRRLFNNAGPVAYKIAPFLLREPEFHDLKWCFSEPDLSKPVCQLATAEQLESDLYTSYCASVGLDHTLKNRKSWEIAYILSVLNVNSMLEAGRIGIGFGTGREPLPSAFANKGIRVTATDAPDNLDFSAEWALGAQWAQGLDDLFKPSLVTKEKFYDMVEFLPVDMNAIPSSLCNYDFCWSSCCLEHLGSIQHGLDFIRNSLDTLRPGGVAVHTTEFNLLSNEATIDGPGLCLFRKRDIEAIMHDLVQDGHHVEPLNFWPGATPVDEHIDLPPYCSSPHLKLAIGEYLTTSFGLTIRKAGNGVD